MDEFVPLCAFGDLPCNGGLHDRVLACSCCNFSEQDECSIVSAVAICRCGNSTATADTMPPSSSVPRACKTVVLVASSADCLARTLTASESGTGSPEVPAGWPRATNLSSPYPSRPSSSRIRSPSSLKGLGFATTSPRVKASISMFRLWINCLSRA